MGKAASKEVLLRFSAAAFDELAAAFDEGVVAAEDVGSQSEEDEGDREEGEGIEAWARIGSLKTRWAEDECRSQTVSPQKFDSEAVSGTSWLRLFRVSVRKSYQISRAPFKLVAMTLVRP